MAEKRARRRGLARLLYLAGWIIALYALSNLNLSSDNFANYTHFIAAVLFWTPILALHVGFHLYAIRWNSGGDERMAYREGYADALEQFADKTYNERPLTREDTEELRVLPDKRKRSG